MNTRQVYVLSRPDGRSERVFLTLRDLIEDLRSAVHRGEKALDVRLEERTAQYRIQCFALIDDQDGSGRMPIECPHGIDDGPHATEEAALAESARLPEDASYEVEVEWVRAEEVLGS